jgi:hypothetical protein
METLGPTSSAFREVQAAWISSRSRSDFDVSMDCANKD